MTTTKTVTHRYFRVCPRGFANEVTYYRVPLAQVAEVEQGYDAGWKDREFDAGNTHASCGWTDDRAAEIPGIAIDWADRNY